MTCDGFSVRGRHLCEDFGLCIADRSLAVPAQKRATVSIPFSHGEIDFSAINGEVYYESRELAYSIDLIADDPAELEAQVSEVAQWLAPVCNDDIAEDSMPGYHWRASAASVGVSRDDSGTAATVEAKFSAYPFALADEECEARIAVGTNPVVNRGSMRARISIVPEGTVTLTVGTLRQTFSGPTATNLYLAPGENEVEVSGGSALIRWREGML